MGILGKCTDFATDSLRIHIFKQLHHVTSLVCISVTMQLALVSLAISPDTNYSFMVEQTMHGGMSNDELRGVAH